nr:3'-5' exonuclease [Tenuifilaceae bacterium]
VYSMNVNYRSTPSYIGSLNGFFSSVNPFNDEKITYTKVNCPDNSEDTFTHNGSPIQNPLEFYQVRNQKQITTLTANSIAELITDEGYKIDDRELTFSDITVIVRTNDQVKKIKDELNKLNIPSVTVDKPKILKTDEADFVRHVMVAAHRPSRKNINRALLSSATNISIRSLVETDELEHLENFIRLKETWNSHGIYAMLSQFIVMYNVRHHCLRMGTQGQRILTNIQHIAEILHRYEYQNKKTPTELIEWFSKSSNESSEEYEQRIESEDNAVKITTIHKSKGLTFGIVFAPFLDLKPKDEDDISIWNFRDEEGIHRFTHQPTDEQVELYRLQEEQENRRLIYVALTRAKYIGVVIVSSYQFDQSCLNAFNLPEFIEAKEGWATQLREPLKIDSTTSFAAKQVPDILVKNHFGIHSYSALSRAHFAFPFEAEELGDENSYDQFVFQDLKRGAKVGTAVHSIFEYLDFANPDSWDQTILDASKYYPNIIKAPQEGNPGNLHHFKQMVEHVLGANITLNGTSFSLSQVSKKQTLPELEFYFSINKVNKTEIDKYLGEDAKLTGEADLQGLMTGFVDLLFEHKGKYYIADWKTNHLGNSVEHYNTQGVEQAMLGSNYHLQYMIYTVAVVRWLRQRIKDFSYEKHFGGIIYLFLRGIRKSKSTGIYVNRPQEEDILLLDQAFSGSHTS